MLIATTYENGSICQHFGKTPQFKIFNVENGSITDSIIVDTEGAGHQALAGFLFGRNISAVIAGGIGQGAIVALARAGIDVIAGASGDADSAVEKYIAGELPSGAAGCGCAGHGHGEEGSACGCGGHDHHGEGSSCGCGGHGHDHGAGSHGCCGG